MKRGIVVLFLMMVLSISLASAEVSFNSPREKYNLGDMASIEGYIELDRDVRDILKFYLDCESSIQVSARIVNVEANKKYFFDEDVNLFGGEGICGFRASFDDEVKVSEKFEIVSDLKGNLFVNENNFKLGDLFDVTGDVFMMDNDPFEGLGIIYFEKGEEEVYFADTFDIFNGGVEYSIILEDLPSNTYSLRLEVFDAYGNNNNFDLGSITVSDVLSASSNTDKENYLPGDRLDISGNVDAEEYKVFFEFDGERFEELFNTEDFDYMFTIRDDISSGAHTINIKVSDNHGNYYEENLEINIIGVPQRLEVRVDENNYLPGNNVEIFASVYDQGEQIFEDFVSIRVLNPKKDEILNMDVDSGSVYGLDLEKYIVPGSYRILAESADFEEEIYFIVDELEEISVYYDMGRLKISNEGNIPIKSEIMVYLDGESYPLSLKVDPSEIEGYDLRGYVKKDGTYDIVVDFKEESYELNANIIDDRGSFEKLTGSVIGEKGVTGGWVVYVVLILLIIIILYFVFSGGSKNKGSVERDRDFREAQAKLKKRRAEKERRKPRRLFQAKDISEKEAKQFRESMVKKMKEK
tara:strand:- start:563 stop:2305 length:1743 start_codon:yes stop_codon:yes gene_type:complete